MIIQFYMWLLCHGLPHKLPKKVWRPFHCRVRSHRRAAMWTQARTLPVLQQGAHLRRLLPQSKQRPPRLQVRRKVDGLTEVTQIGGPNKLTLDYFATAWYTIGTIMQGCFQMKIKIYKN